MAKKLLSVWLSLTILLFSSISIYAGESVRGQFFLKNISINGTQIFNYELNNPLFTYKGAAYVPLDSGMSKVLGLQAEMDWESRTLKLLVQAPAQKSVSDGTLQSNLQDVTCEVISDVQVIAYKAASAETEEDAAAKEAAGEIVPPELSAVKLDLGELPLLRSSNQTLYFPVKVLAQPEASGWSLFYDSYSGLYISTSEAVEAKTYFNEPQSRYIRGLVNYIRKCNSSYTVEAAQDLVAIMQHEARIYKIDHTLLLAMAQKESTFNPKTVAAGGSVGLMQILPSTAKGYGVSKAQLLDTHANVQLGARYLRERLDRFDGNITKALSAYNQGTGAVSRGSYSTRYASRILGAQAQLKSYMADNGYGKGY